ncbi:L-threonine O-3-phosphate decarboxylase [Desulfitobacterium dichloroeliminans LMG P-21439]|uniref:threonine-phosphate decarboxylase n=1 Tax=Desulfitobacterium dichloroeliminans (strain LMG P-21439 / DCA1) TaxID=871963 RepID=L0F409_DESDL|nr:threonine-phosphate decarboxylase CobD [Desulfitobacterium dichloroeliminans]AGA68549.1 L-threonine O-3-phosphate decarboxylase [Desulfitobacterium dichloroeliminans LMG P-21439]
MHGGNLLEAVEQYGRDSFTDLSANINAFGPPEAVWRAIEQSLKAIIHYPDPEYRRLRRKMAQRYSLTEEEILLGNGAGELIFLLLHALKPGRVLIPQPAFSEYERAALACGAEVNKIFLGVEGWDSLDFDRPETQRAWEKAMAENDLIFINSPHNPTGSSLRREQFETIIALAHKSKTWVVLDESFVDFLEDKIRWSGKEYLSDFPNLLVLYSLTKFYSIPGLRLGCIFADPSLLGRLKKQRDPWAVNALAEEAGLAALTDESYAEQVRERLGESKAFFYKEFQSRIKEGKLSGIEVYPSTVNFALIEILDTQGAKDSLGAKLRKKEILQRLGQKGILVRDCDNFQGLSGEFIRVAIKAQESMEALLEGLQMRVK